MRTKAWSLHKHHDTSCRTSVNMGVMTGDGVEVPAPETGWDPLISDVAP